MSIHTRFEEHAAANPLRTAIVYQGSQVSYSELNARANQFARWLEESGARPGDFIGLMLMDGIAFAAGMLGILKMGGICAPLNVGQPPEYTHKLLAEAGIRRMVCESRTLANGLPGQAHAHEDVRSAASRFSDRNLLRPAKPGANAYVIYTSGSTGAPKGVLVPHHSVLHGVGWTLIEPFEAGDVCSMKGSFGFASSAYSLFRPLIHGVPLVILPPASVSNAHTYITALESHGVTHVATIPALLREVLRTGGASLRQRLRRLKVAGTSGGALSDRVIQSFAECLPQAWLINGYSSTEVGTFATRLVIPPGQVRQASIGTPYRSAMIRLVDPQLRVAGEGTVGELYIGSPYLSNGYLNHPDANAQRFVKDPAGESPLRFFRTGDLARLLPNGEFEFCGRRDLQVKVRGMRVGVESVEETLRQLDGVQDVAVAASGPDGESRLAAYVVAAAGHAPSLTELRAWSKAALPDHMIPARFALVHELPRTVNGKIDRAALSQDDEVTRLSSQPREERSATETRVAQIWQTMLAVGHVDSHSDFFELGGDSLSATEMLARVEQEFGLASAELGIWDSGLTTFLTNPSLANLVSGVDEAAVRAEGGTNGNRILAFNAEGLRTPLVFFPAAVDGLPFYLRYLADALGPDQPFYVIAHASVGAGLEGADVRRTIQEIAAEGIASLRRVLPPGPLVMAGHCYGGVLAYEAAHQLLQANERVTGLLLFDAWAPGFPKPLASWRRYIAALRHPPTPAEAWKHLRTLIRIAEKRNGTRVMRMLRREGHRPASRLSLVSLVHLADYRPIPLPLEVVQFLAQDQPMSTRVLEDPRLGWREWLGDRYRVKAVPGDHFSMFQPPHTSTLAAEIVLQGSSAFPLESVL